MVPVYQSRLESVSGLIAASVGGWPLGAYLSTLSLCLSEFTRMKNRNHAGRDWEDWDSSDGEKTDKKEQKDKKEKKDKKKQQKHKNDRLAMVDAARSM